MPTLIGVPQISTSITPISTSSFANKLPLPKLGSSNQGMGAGINQVHNSAILQYSSSLNNTRHSVGNEPWRLPKKRKRRTKLELKAAAERALLAERSKDQENCKSRAEEAMDEDQIDLHPSQLSDANMTSTPTKIKKSDFIELAACASLPQNIFATEEDSVDLTNAMNVNHKIAILAKGDIDQTGIEDELNETVIETVDLTTEEDDEVDEAIAGKSKGTVVDKDGLIQMPQACLVPDSPAPEIIFHLDQEVATTKTGNKKKGISLQEKMLKKKDNDVKTIVSKQLDSTTAKSMISSSKVSTVASSGGTNKRSKNSYSIAALCQISVNIGGDPSAGAVIVGAPCEGMTVSSPGLISLTSVGTGSPIGTPAPTPTPPILTSNSNATMPAATSQPLTLSFSSTQHSSPTTPTITGGNAKSIAGTRIAIGREKNMADRPTTSTAFNANEFSLELDEHCPAMMRGINPHKLIQELTSVNKHSDGECSSSFDNEGKTSEVLRKPTSQASINNKNNRLDMKQKGSKNTSNIGSSHGNDNIEPSDPMQPPSPTKSYLNQFPVVSGSNKKLSDKTQVVSRTRNKSHTISEPPSMTPSNNSTRSTPQTSTQSITTKSYGTSTSQPKTLASGKTKISSTSHQYIKNPMKTMPHTRPIITNNTPKSNIDLSVYDFTESKQETLLTANIGSHFNSKKEVPHTILDMRDVTSNVMTSSSKDNIAEEKQNEFNPSRDTYTKKDSATKILESKKNKIYAMDAKSNDSSKGAATSSAATENAKKSPDTKRNNLLETSHVTNACQRNKSNEHISSLRISRHNKSDKLNTEVSSPNKSSRISGSTSSSATDTSDTGYDLSVTRPKRPEGKSQGNKEGQVPLMQETGDPNRYLQSLPTHTQAGAVFPKVHSGTSPGNITSFSPAQAFAPSTFTSTVPGVSGSISSISDFIGHPMQTTYSSAYSQHNFPPSISQSQYNYHHAVGVASIASSPPSNLISYSSPSIHNEPHQDSGSSTQPPNPMILHPELRKNSGGVAREDANSFDYFSVSSKHPHPKAQSFPDTLSGNVKIQDHPNTRSSKQTGGVRSNNPDNKNYPQTMPPIQYATMFSSHTSQHSTSLSNPIQQVENDPSSLFSVNQLVSHKNSGHGNIHSSTLASNHPSGKKTTKRSQNSNSIRPETSNSSSGSSSIASFKPSKQTKVVPGNSDSMKEGSINQKDATKGTVGQINKETAQNTERLEMLNDGAKRQSRSNLNTMTRSMNSSSSQRSRSSGSTGASKRSYSAESLFSSENNPANIPGASQNPNSVPGLDGSKSNKHSDINSSHQQSTSSSGFNYPGHRNTGNILASSIGSTSSLSSLSRSEYSWMQSSDISAPSRGASQSFHHNYQNITNPSATTPPSSESHASQIHQVMGGGGVAETPSPISFVQEFDFPSSVLGGGVAQSDMISSMIFQPSLPQPTSTSSSTRGSRTIPQPSKISYPSSGSTSSIPFSTASIVSSSQLAGRNINNYNSISGSNASNDGSPTEDNLTGPQQHPMSSVTPSIFPDQQQQFGHQYLFDNTNLFPLPTLTPPATIPMSATSGSSNFSLEDPGNHFAHYHTSSSLYGQFPAVSSSTHSQNILLSSSPSAATTSMPSYTLPQSNAHPSVYQTPLSNAEPIENLGRGSSRVQAPITHSSASSHGYSKSPSKHPSSTTGSLSSTSSATNLASNPQSQIASQRQHSTNQHHHQSQQHQHQDVSMQHQSQQVILPAPPTAASGMLSAPNAPAIVPIGAHSIPAGNIHHPSTGNIISGGPQSSQQAYINFNLSTICPEINAAFVPHITDKLGLLPPNPQTAPITHSNHPPNITHSISSSTSHPLIKSSSSRSNPSNSGLAMPQSTPTLSSTSGGASNVVGASHDVLPHSISIIGQGIPPVRNHCFICLKDAS